MIGRPNEHELANEITRRHWERLAGREADACQPVVLALGKLGGREPNYHSDLDLIFLFEAGGNTFPSLAGRPIVGDYHE